jgi:type I restriction enzyme S subunit
MIFEKYDEFQRSEIKYIEKFPNEWSLERLKNIALIRYSNVDKKTYENQEQVLLCNYTDVYKNEFITNNIEFMKATASYEEIRKFKIKKGDVLFTKDSESFDDNVNPCFINDDFENVLCGYHLAQVRPNKNKIYSKWLFRVFQSINYNYYFAINSKGITRVGLGISAVNDAKIYFPSIDIQTKIANYLDIKTKKIDDEITLLEQKIIKYKELKQTLINETVLRGLDKSVELQDSGIEWIGDIPKSWKTDRLKNIFDERVGKNLNKKTDEAVTKNILSVMKDVGVINHRDKGNVGNKMSEDITNYKLVYPDDIVVNKMNIMIGSVGISKEFGALSVIYIILITKKDSYARYYDYFFKMKEFQKNLRRIATGILEIREAVNMTLFMQEMMLKPPLEEQIKIANYLDEKTQKLDQITKTIKDKIDVLKEFRKTLINDVVTGKVKVEDEI